MPKPTHIDLDAQVLYVADAYCGWCWGFAPQLAKFAASSRYQLPFRVISGGLFVGERHAPISAYPHIPEANQAIARMTGAQFGPRYQRLLAEGGFMLDSLAAARGLAGLRVQSPERGAHLLHRMQEAFYVKGQSLSDASTYRRIADEEGLNADRVVDYLVSDEGYQAAMADFQLAHRLGANSYPTLLLLKDDNAHRLPATGASLADFDEALGRLI